MKYVVYADRKSDEKKLMTAIRKQVPDQHMDIHETLPLMIESLRTGRYLLTAAIFVINPKTLDTLLSYRDLMVDIPLIMIITEMDDDTISVAHKFYPRFVTYGENEFDDVAAVVQKMNQRTGHVANRQPTRQ